MIKLEIILPETDVRVITDALKKLSVGGITISKSWGRRKSKAPKIHASTETEIFIPEFGERFIIEVVVKDEMKNDIIATVRANSRFGKIFIWPISEVHDMQTEKKDENAI